MTSRATLRTGVVQLAIEPRLAANQTKIVRFIGEAKAAGCDLVIFPEGALDWEADTAREDIDRSIAAISAAAGDCAINVVTGLMYRRTAIESRYNRALAFDRKGALLLAYDKLWNDPRFNSVPRAFLIDGVACNTAICADRWIRAVEELPVVEGARILIEISNNSYDEWVPDLGWYWNVPRAVRNEAFVIFCNSARDSAGRIARFKEPGHGHSAIIDPAGNLVVAAGEEADRLLVADLDLSRATAGEAIRRHHHPLTRPFWDAGAILLRGGSVQVEPFVPPATPERTITVAAAQIAVSRSVGVNLATMTAAIAEAAQREADLVAFPELALTGTHPDDIAAFGPADLDGVLQVLADAARAHGMAVAFGAPAPGAGRPANSAFVLDREGKVLTRYDQLVTDGGTFAPGGSTRAMWFALDGVPGVISIGSDSRWNELAELAGVRGAKLHIHLANAGGDGPAGDLRRRQFWVTLASFYTLTVTVNAAENAGLDEASVPASGRSVIWNDFRPTTNHGRPYATHKRFCAVPIVEAGAAPQLIVGAAEVPAVNLSHQAMVATSVPGMRAWYDAGAHAISAEMAQD